MKEVFYHNNVCRKAMFDRYVEWLMQERMENYFSALGFADMYERSEGWAPLDEFSSFMPEAVYNRRMMLLEDFLACNYEREIQLHDEVLMGFLYETVTTGKRSGDRMLLCNLDDDDRTWLAALCASLCQTLHCSLPTLERGMADYMLWRYFCLSKSLDKRLATVFGGRVLVEEEVGKLVKYRLRRETQMPEHWKANKLARLHGLEDWQAPDPPADWPMFDLVNKRMLKAITELQYQITVAYYDTADPSAKYLWYLSHGQKMNYEKELDVAGVEKVATNMAQSVPRTRLIFAKGMERTQETFDQMQKEEPVAYAFFCQMKRWGAFGATLSRDHVLTLTDVEEAIRHEGTDLDARPAMRWLYNLWRHSVDLVCSPMAFTETGADGEKELPAEDDKTAGGAKAKSWQLLNNNESGAGDTLPAKGDDAVDARNDAVADKGEEEADKGEEEADKGAAASAGNGGMPLDKGAVASPKAEDTLMRPYLIDSCLTSVFDFSFFMENINKILGRKNINFHLDEKDFVQVYCQRFWRRTPRPELLPYVARVVNVLIRDCTYVKWPECAISEEEWHDGLPLDSAAQDRAIKSRPQMRKHVSNATRMDRMCQIIRENNGAVSTDDILLKLNNKYVNEPISRDCLSAYLGEDKRVVCVNRKASLYDLRERNDIPFHSIRESLEFFLQQHDTPMPLDEIVAFAIKYYPHTEKRNIRINMEMSKRFESYIGSIFGLTEKDYDEATLEAKHIYPMKSTCAGAKELRRQLIEKAMVSSRKQAQKSEATDSTNKQKQKSEVSSREQEQKAETETFSGKQEQKAEMETFSSKQEQKAEVETFSSKQEQKAEVETFSSKQEQKAEAETFSSKQEQKAETEQKSSLPWTSLAFPHRFVNRTESKPEDKTNGEKK